MKADIIADVQFLTTEQGGRRGRTPTNWFGCPMIVDSDYWDCRLLLEEIGPVRPGQEVRVPIIFILPEEVVPRLTPRKKFQLWEGRVIANGEVVSILDK